ncbi:transcriptional regulator [Streptomyces cyaneofuscatus]
MPFQLAWSGLSEFDLGQPRLRMSYYRIVLSEGTHDDLVESLHRDLLLTMWPTWRMLISRHIRDVWDGAFDELAGSGGGAA